LAPPPPPRRRRRRTTPPLRHHRHATAAVRRRRAPRHPYATTYAAYAARLAAEPLDLAAFLDELLDQWEEAWPRKRRRVCSGVGDEVLELWESQ